MVFLSFSRSDLSSFFLNLVILFCEHTILPSILLIGKRFKKRSLSLSLSSGGSGPFLAHLERSMVRAPKDKGNMVE